MAKPMTLLELRDAIAKAIADEVGHGMREKCERQADAVLKVVAPQLLATADDATLRQQAGRVDAGLWAAVDRMIVDAWKLGGCEKTLDMLAMRDRFTAALAQNTQGEDKGGVWQYRVKGSDAWRDAEGPINSDYNRERWEVRRVYLHAERARVPVGIEVAIAHIQQKADAYAEEHCGVECDTGATTYHYGQAGEDYHHGLLELVDELQALAAAPSQPKDAGEVSP